MNWAQLCKLARTLPEVSEDIWFRTPALKVRGKSFVRLKEDGASVVFVLESVEEQEMLVAAQPEVYFVTDHYRGWPAVLARLSELRAADCKLRLEEGWRVKAPRALVKERDAARGNGEPRAAAASPPAENGPARGSSSAASAARKGAPRKSRSRAPA